ncbi:hypothetical protein TA3x_004965 [Tundrisphaera sp. TA3]|uniref:hypothetical protein n=1 Tax=Tundrisphaera sp. TA3 TaxID=3435775 RepID=UPI003EBDAD4E
MLLRALILAQIVWVAFSGAVVRGRMMGYPFPILAEEAAALSFYPLVIGFPIVVVSVARRAAWPGWKRSTLLVLEMLLTYAAFIAIMPLVQ